MLSGVFFRWASTPKDFLRTKSEALLKPYFSVLFLLLFYDLLSGDDTLVWQLIGILYGNGDTIRWTPLWFLSHLFVVYVFSYFAFRFGYLYKLGVGTPILLLLFLVVGSILIDYFWYKRVDLFSHVIELPGLPFSVDIILITSSYFILGRFINNRLVEFRPSLWALAVSLLGFFFISQFTTAHIDLNKRIYNDPAYATLGALCGIYIIISLSYIVSKSRWLSYIPLILGKASLYILIFHSFIMGSVFNYFYDRTFSETHMALLAFISFGLGLFIPLVIKWLVEKNDILSLAFLPFRSNKLLQRALGARRREKS